MLLHNVCIAACAANSSVSTDINACAAADMLCHALLCCAVPQVDDSYMTVATITGGSLATMTNVQTAPRISAGVFARGYSFHNGGEYEGLNAMSQPETDIQLFSGDTGMVGRTFAVRTYGVRTVT